MARTDVDEVKAELGRAHGRFDISLHLYMTWLQDALTRRDKATGFDKVKLQGIVVLAEKAAAVFAVSAFEGFLKASAAAKMGTPSPRDLHGYGDLEAMLRESWGLAVGRVIMKRSEYLDLLLAWRHTLIHGGDLPDETLRQRLSRIYGPQVAASWTPEAPQFPGPGGVLALLANLAECEQLIYLELQSLLANAAGP